MDLDWSLFYPALAGIGAIATAIATVLKLYFFPWRQGVTRRRLAEKKTFEESKIAVQSVTQQLRDSIEERVQSNKFSQGANVSWYVTEFETRIKEYHKRFDGCRDWLDACKAVIQIEMMRVTKDKFPKTVTEYSLCDGLQADPLIAMYVGGESVTLTFVSENYPSLRKDIDENMKYEKREHKLNLLFLEINRVFKDNNVLKRFRQEKQDLMEFAEQLVNDLEKETKRIDNELSRYSDLKYDDHSPETSRTVE